MGVLCEMLTQSLPVEEARACGETTLAVNTASNKSSSQLRQGTRWTFFSPNTVSTGAGLLYTAGVSEFSRASSPSFEFLSPNVELNHIKLPHLPIFNLRKW